MRYRYTVSNKRKPKGHSRMDNREMQARYISSRTKTNITYHHDITEILLKVALNIITLK
jgi:hypothetical protein